MIFFCLDVVRLTPIFDKIKEESVSSINELSGVENGVKQIDETFEMK